MRTHIPADYKLPTQVKTENSLLASVTIDAPNHTRRIAAIVGAFPPPIHGVSVINAKLAANAEARGISLVRVDTSPGARKRGLAYHLVRLSRTLLGCVGILSAAKETRRYVLSVEGDLGLLYNLLLAIAIAARRTPIAFYHHSTRYVLDDSVLMRCLVNVGGEKTLHIMCSEHMARLFCDRYSISRTLIIDNAAWVDSPHHLGRESNGLLHLGLLSTLSLAKGLARAIDTLRAVRRAGISAKLYLAGALFDGEARRALDGASAEFGSEIVHVGIVSGDAKTAFYSNLDYFLFPSLYKHETQSLVVPEALSAGIPVIAYDHRMVNEAIGKTGGLLIPVDSAFAPTAARWIFEGERDGLRMLRRRAAVKQYHQLRSRADGQMDQLFAWLRAS